ncbi:MAG TPA: Uma2 family endonuclease [Vicinamibacterales bacterium]|nr:Uma2 family endonuclease [Vicinamibacterales bacterium]
MAFNAAELLKNYERHAGGLMFSSPIDIVLDSYNVVQPDVVFFGRDRACAIDMHRAIRTAPDLAIEVLSRATAAIDRGKKLRILARFGVGECWLIDPIASTLEQFALAWRDGAQQSSGIFRSLRRTIGTRPPDMPRIV